MHPTIATVPAWTAANLIRAGLLTVGEACRIHPTAVFLPADPLGTLRPITLGTRAGVGAFAVVHGGTRIDNDVHLGHQAIVGEPEYGYALRQVHPGAGGATIIGAGVVIRAGAIIYAGVQIGVGSTIGHRTLLRTNVIVGAGSQLAANLTVERGTRLGLSTGSPRTWPAWSPTRPEPTHRETGRDGCCKPVDVSPSAATVLQPTLSPPLLGRPSHNSAPASTT